MWKATSANFSRRLRSTRYGRQFSSTVKSTEMPGCIKPAQSCPPIPPPPPPPPPPEPKSGGFIGKLLGFTTVAAGGLVGYAWYDASFKKTVEDNVPYSKETFDFIFPYLPDSGAVKTDVKSVTDKFDLTFMDQSSEPVKKEKPKEPVGKATPVKLDKQSEKDRLKTEAKQKLNEQELEEAADNAALEVILEELMAISTLSTQKAVNNQKRVIETTKEHTRLLRTAMDDMSDILHKDNQWQAVNAAFETREQTVKESEGVLFTARSDLEKLKHAIEDGKCHCITRRNKVISKAQETLNKYNGELGLIGAQVTKIESEGKMMVKYKDLVDKGRKQFQKELESIMPEVKLGDKKGKKLTEDELNSLIAHAHRRIEQLQKQMAEQLAMEAQHIECALEQQIMEDDKLAALKIEMEAEKIAAEFNLEKDNWSMDARIEFEKELRHQLTRQAAAHSDHLHDVLNIQQEEWEKQFERNMHVKLLHERQVFQSEVAGWIARLKGIECAVENRAEQEKTARMAQDLWLACLALNGAIRLGNDEEVEWEDKVKPLVTEIIAVSEAAKQHPFVETIIRTIPDEALVRGVWTEDSLRERFKKVNRVCRRVAMIDETGGSLFKYFMSYIQSFFILDSVYAKSESAEVDIDTLDTFAILAHTDYYMERGDIEQAVRFMNQLVGDPRRVAADWLKEAKLLLETRQAAYVLTAFASASGLNALV